MALLVAATAGQSIEEEMEIKVKIVDLERRYKEAAGSMVDYGFGGRAACRLNFSRSL